MPHKDVERKAAERGVLRLCLEMELRDFERRQRGFLQDLAALADVAPEELWITDVRKGCVIVRLEVPKGVEEQVEELWNAETPSPAMMRFLKKYNVTWLRFDDMVQRHFMIILRPEITSGRKITWLHFSDLHRRSGTGAKKWSQDQVVTKLEETLAQLLEKRGVEPDFLFFTGDVAYSGQDAEYEEAKTFLQNVLDSLPKHPRIFFVPGNHDVTWSNIDWEFDKQLRKKLDSREKVIAHLLEEENRPLREQEFKRLENYQKFFQTEVWREIIDEKGYFYTADVEQAGIRVGIAGLNSAWRSTRKDGTKKKAKVDRDEHYLLLGEPQIREAAEQLKKTQLRIALLHHPPFSSEWYMEFEADRHKHLFKEFDFLLRGHEHRSEYMEAKFLEDGGMAFHMASTALYLHDEYRNGFNAVSLNLDTGFGTVYYWKYFEDNYVWAPNVGQAENGYYSFPLSPRLMARIKTG